MAMEYMQETNTLPEGAFWNSGGNGASITTESGSAVAEAGGGAADAGSELALSFTDIMDMGVGAAQSLAKRYSAPVEVIDNLDKVGTRLAVYEAGHTFYHFVSSQDYSLSSTFHFGYDESSIVAGFWIGEEVNPLVGGITGVGLTIGGNIAAQQINTAMNTTANASVNWSAWFTNYAQSMTNH